MSVQKPVENSLWIVESRQTEARLFIDSQVMAMSLSPRVMVKTAGMNKNKGNILRHSFR